MVDSVGAGSFFDEILRGVDRPEVSVPRVLVLIKDFNKLFAMFSKLEADVDYVFPIGFDVHVVGLFNDFVSEGRVFEVFL